MSIIVWFLAWINFFPGHLVEIEFEGSGGKAKDKSDGLQKALESPRWEDGTAKECWVVFNSSGRVELEGPASEPVDSV